MKTRLIKRLSIFYTVSLTILMGTISCERNPFQLPQEKTKSPGFLYYSELSCPKKSPNQRLPLLNEIKSSADRLRILVIRTNNWRQAPQLEGIEDSWARVYTPFDPLIVSEEQMKSDLVAINKDLDRVEMRDDMAVVATLKEIDGRLRRLMVTASRWESIQCRRSELETRTREDVRDFYRLKAKLDPDEQCDKENFDCLFSHWDPNDETTDQKILILKLCGKKRSRAVCEIEKRLMRSPQKTTEFYQFYYRERLKHLNQIYQRQSKEVWNCHGQDDFWVLDLPYYWKGNSYPLSDSEKRFIEEYIKSKWSHGSFQLNLREVEESSPEKSIVFDWRSKILSHVNANRPRVIQIDSRLRGQKLALTIAHELGHVLGFKDCYVEFYEREKANLVYYSLDIKGQNLMCHLGDQARIPESYTEQLINDLCRF